MTIPTASADDILNEMEALISYLSAEFPDAQFVRQMIPKDPQPGTFVVAFQNSSPRRETALTYVDTREWQIIYIAGTRPIDNAEVLRNLTKVQKLTYANQRMAIPINDGSLRYMRVTGFNFGQPAELEGGNKAGLAILTTEVRKARDYETYEKIMEVQIRRG